MADFRELCVDLLRCWDDEVEDLNDLGDIFERFRAALAEPEPVGLSPREVEAQDAFTQIRDEILSLSDGVEVNEVLGIIDNYTPEWVWRDRPVAEPEPLPDTDVMQRLLSAPMDSRGYVDLRPGRANLAEPEPPADGEVAELVAALRIDADYALQKASTSAFKRFHRAADLLECLVAEPEGPSDDELLKLTENISTKYLCKHKSLPSDWDPGDYASSTKGLIEFARAVLARFRLGYR